MLAKILAHVHDFKCERRERERESDRGKKGDQREREKTKKSIIMTRKKNESAR